MELKTYLYRPINNSRPVLFSAKDKTALPDKKMQVQNHQKPVYFKDFFPYLNTSNLSDLKQFNAALVQKESKELYEEQTKMCKELEGLLKTGAKVSSRGNKIITEVTPLPDYDNYTVMKEITPDGKVAKRAVFIGENLLSLRENTYDDGLCERSDKTSTFIKGKLTRCSKGVASWNNFFNESQETYSFIDSSLLRYSKGLINFPELDEAKLSVLYRDGQIYSIKQNRKEKFPFQTKEDIEYFNNIKKEMKSNPKPSPQVFSARFIELLNECLSENLA